MICVIFLTEFNTGLSLKWQQYKAMLLKRFLNARREKKLVLTQLILPLLMVCLALLLIKTLQEPMQNEPPRILNLSNLSIKGAPNNGFYADFRPNVDPDKKNALFDVSWRFPRSLGADHLTLEGEGGGRGDCWSSRIFFSSNLVGRMFFPFFSHKFSITFVLHAIFSFRQALAGHFFSKSPNPPPPLKS